MGGQGVDVATAPLLHELGGLHHRAGGVDLVVDQEDVFTVDLADEVQHAGIGAVPTPALLDDGERQVHLFGEVRASFTRPTSPATTTASERPLLRAYSASMCWAVMSSTGMEKKPWIWAACRSIVSTLSAPATVIMSAMSRAVMGTRGWSFL